MQQPQRTIVFTHGGGRFGNQLMVFGHLIALAEELPEFRILNHSYWPYADFSAGTEVNPRCVYPSRGASPGLAVALENVVRRVVWKRRRAAANRIIGQASQKLLPWRSVSDRGRTGEISLSDPAMLASLRKRRTTLLSGWRVREWSWFDKHQNAIRAFLRPASRFQPAADSLMSRLRQKYETLVGVLIRQDDYRLWADGRYFFPSEHYRTWLAQLRERFGPRVGLVIATDEKQPPGTFDDLNVEWCTGEKAGAGHYMESFLQLSMCDVIASVPSTFSGWAAFFGEKPILPISAAQDDLRVIPLLERHLLDARKHPAFSHSVE